MTGDSQRQCEVRLRDKDYELESLIPIVPVKEIEGRQGELGSWHSSTDVALLARWVFMCGKCQGLSAVLQPPEHPMPDLIAQAKEVMLVSIVCYH